MRIAVPNKGRLHDPTMDLFERAGIHVENGADRKLYADTVDPDLSVLFARAADIPEYVADGAAAVGITGLDQVRESQVDLTDLLDLEFGRCRLVLAAPEDGDVDDVEALANGTVATEFPNVTADYFAGTPVSPEIVEVSGATELTPHVEIADAIVDITSTGTTLRMNRLAVVDEVLASSVHLFARPDIADDPKVRQVATALESVLAADGKRYLMMNVPADRLADVEAVIPGMGGPTVMDVVGGASETPRGGGDSEEQRSSGRASGRRGSDTPSDETSEAPDASDSRTGNARETAEPSRGPRAEAADGRDTVAVHVVVDEREVFETITRLKDAGASDILVTEIERLVA